MEIIWFTLMAVILYLVSDGILEFIEKKKGERLPNRSVIFFIIISILAFISFQIIQNIGLVSDPQTQTQDAPIASQDNQTGSPQDPSTR